MSFMCDNLIGLNGSLAILQPQVCPMKSLPPMTISPVDGVSLTVAEFAAS